MAEEDRAFDREKLNAEVEARRTKAMQPPAFAQNAMWFISQPKEVQRAILTAQDAYDPTVVSTPQGTQRIPRVMSKKIGDRTYYNIGGEWFEEE
jgi:hypothetical protein